MNQGVLKIDEQCAALALESAAQMISGNAGEIVLDFSSLRRMDPSALRALDQFAELAQEKNVRVRLQGVSIEVYKTLKLMNIAHRFSFAS